MLREIVPEVSRFPRLKTRSVSDQVRAAPAPTLVMRIVTITFDLHRIRINGRVVQKPIGTMTISSPLQPLQVLNEFVGRTVLL